MSVPSLQINKLLHDKVTWHKFICKYSLVCYKLTQPVSYWHSDEKQLNHIEIRTSNNQATIYFIQSQGNELIFYVRPNHYEIM